MEVVSCNIIKVNLELGGKVFVIVLVDVNLDLVVKVIVVLCIINSG